MAVYCYFGAMGEPVSFASPWVVSVCMTDDGKFRAESRKYRHYLASQEKFAKWTQVQSWLRARFPNRSYDSAWDIGCVIYYKCFPLIQCRREEAECAVAPVNKSFASYAIRGCKKYELSVSKFDVCNANLKSFARYCRDNDDAFTWLDSEGTELEAGAKTGSYLRIRLLQGQYALYSEASGSERLFAGTQADCVSYIKRKSAEQTELEAKVEAEPSIVVSVKEKAVEQPKPEGSIAVPVVEPIVSARPKSPVQEWYYDSDYNAEGDIKTTSSRYKIHFLVTWQCWAASSRGSSKGRFTRMTDIRFKNVNDALGWIKLYVGATSLEFLNGKRLPCSYTLATLCRRTDEDGVVVSFRRKGYDWLQFLDGTEEDVTLFADNYTVFHYTEVGKECNVEDAAYREFVETPNLFHRFLARKNSSWSIIKCGTPDEISAFRAKVFASNAIPAKEVDVAAQSNLPTAKAEPADVPEVEVVPSNVLAGEKQPIIQPCDNASSVHVPHASVKKTWELVKDSTWLRGGDLMGYLIMCVSRNRVAGDSPIFNTRLCDKINQPVYGYDLDYKFRKGKGDSYVDFTRVSFSATLHDYQRFVPGVTEAPEPVQFFTDISKCVWDPTKPLLPLTQHTLEHICVDRIKRFPKELQLANPVHLITAVKDSLLHEVERAKRDIFYALPAYSKEHEELSMLLPIYIPLLFGNKVVVTLVLSATTQGYRLCTVLDTGRAVRSVSVFRDPRTTWLKECYNDEPIVDC